ncbi:hypothetical protein D1AOALGA4SA_1041 [Olavius algarvensis Delta 1 endosymbiont]|nr:hypothetical protein D1AOALGA4SA_1041 [Olavius algarvensis Delta 1 endosymbiont]
MSGFSGATGQTNGRSNRKRNSSATNVECRLTNVELRNPFYFIFLKEQSEAIPPYVNRHSSFQVVSHERRPPAKGQPV